MVLVPPGKRKLLNNSPSSTKSSKRAAQTISGIMLNNQQQSTTTPTAASNTRAAKRIQSGGSTTSTTPHSKRISAYSKNHIKNNVEFMQKSSTHSSGKLSTPPSSKFLSAKLRNNSNFIDISDNSTNNGTNKPNTSSNKSPKGLPSPAHKPKSKNQLNDQHMDVLGSNGSDPIIQMNSYTKENLEEHELFYARRLAEFKYQLEKLQKLNDAEFEMVTDQDMLIRKLEATLYDEETIERSAYGSSFPFFSRFIQQIKGIKRESDENMSIVTNWYEMQKSEAMAQYSIEHSRAIQEFQDKRRELKDGLKTENEDKKRQIEVDRNQLDINMDVTDAKPKVTRKLRRRNNNDFGVDSSNGLDSASSLHLVAGVSWFYLFMYSFF